MTTPAKRIYEAFGRIVSDLNAALNKPIWFQITESDDAIDGSFLLRDQANLDRDDWCKMLRLCSFIGPNDSVASFKTKRWEHFLGEFVVAKGFTYELKPTRIKKRKLVWFVKLGSTLAGGIGDAMMQTQSKIPCPKIRKLACVVKELHNLLREQSSSGISGSTTTNTSTTTNASTSTNTSATTNTHATDNPSTDTSLRNSSENNGTKTSTTVNATSDSDCTANEMEVPESVETNNPTTDAILFNDINVSAMNDGQLSLLGYKIAQEQKARALSAAGVGKLKSWSFEIANGNNDVYVCIPVPKQHRNDNAFKRYQTRCNAYVDEFCRAAGSGDSEVGAQRLLRHLAANYSELYATCGREYGMVFAGTMDSDSLAAMAVDANLKKWQLQMVLKHVEFATNHKLSSVSVKEMEKVFSQDMVIPETGKYLYETVNDKGTTEYELVHYDYQSMVEVFQYVVAQKIMEHGVDIISIVRVAIAPGGDHGIEAFRLNLKVLIIFESNGEYNIVKDDIGISTVFCKKDSSEVLQNTILDQLTADLRTINDSSLVIEEDTSGFVKCSLHRRPDVPPTAGKVVDKIDIFQIGDLKWLAMLLGMENHSGIWCIKCLLDRAMMQQRNHEKGEERTIASIIETVSRYNIDENTTSTPRYKGVMGKPLWDFIPIKNYILPLLHMWMGIFNDIDDWFLKQVDKLVWKDEQETTLIECMNALDKQINSYTDKIKDFTVDTEGKSRVRNK